MLSISESSGHAWRFQLCNALPSKHDYDDDEVRQLFAEGIAWAKENGIPVDPGDHAAEFIASRDAAEPRIPEFMRKFCAAMNNIKVATSGSAFYDADAAEMVPRRRARRSSRPAQQAPMMRSPQPIRI